DRWLLRLEVQDSDHGRAAGERTSRRPSHGLSHRDGRSPFRSELEARAQQIDWGQPEQDQRDSAVVRRSAARRKRPASAALTSAAAGRRIVAFILAGATLTFGARASDARPEPDSYRTEDYRAPSPGWTALALGYRRPAAVLWRLAKPSLGRGQLVEIVRT